LASKFHRNINYLQGEKFDFVGKDRKAKKLYAGAWIPRALFCLSPAASAIARSPINYLHRNRPVGRGQKITGSIEKPFRHAPMHRATAKFDRRRKQVRSRKHSPACCAKCRNVRETGPPACHDASSGRKIA
jgi:hypothetical protein